MSDKRPNQTPQAFLKSVHAKAIGPMYTFAHGGVTYRVADRELLARALYDLFKQQSVGKPWAAPGGKVLPPYNPFHEPTEAFSAAVVAYFE